MKVPYIIITDFTVFLIIVFTVKSKFKFKLMILGNVWNYYCLDQSKNIKEHLYL